MLESTYQVNDASAVLPAVAASRTDLGLTTNPDNYLIGSL